MVDKQDRDFQAMIDKQKRDAGGTAQTTATGGTAQTTATGGTGGAQPAAGGTSSLTDEAGVTTNPGWTDTTTNTLDKLTNDLINGNDNAIGGGGGTPPAATAPAQPSAEQQIADAEEAALEAANTAKVQQLFAHSLSSSEASVAGSAGSIDWSEFNIGDPNQPAFGSDLFNTDANFGGSTIEAFNATAVSATAGNDTIAINNPAATQKIEGGEGVNMAEFAGDPADFNIVKDPGGTTTITNTKTGTTTELSNISFINIIPPGGENAGLIYDVGAMKTQGGTTEFYLIDNSTNRTASGVNTNTSQGGFGSLTGGEAAATTPAAHVAESSSPAPEGGVLDAVRGWLDDFYDLIS
jgi:hypothetical protein